ncbi:unnamed protein product [Auanema sp. JU1783]|nr:unnamed protein product [Auanema sp. JU1783]
MSRRPPPSIEGLHSLKVDNISYNTTQADLRRIFDKYGEIGDIHIPRDKYSRQSKGFGFVRFYSRRDAEYAQERTDGKWVDGRELRVALARYERPIDERGRYRSAVDFVAVAEYLKSSYVMPVYRILRHFCSRNVFSSSFNQCY